jgi:hypothetical protein
MYGREGGRKKKRNYLKNREKVNNAGGHGQNGVNFNSNMHKTHLKLT